MSEFMFSNLRPDFNDMIKVLDGTAKFPKVYFVEIVIDEEIKKEIIEKYFGLKNISKPEILISSKESAENIEFTIDVKETQNYYQQLIDFYYRLGYSVIPDLDYLFNLNILNTVKREGKDPSGQFAGKERHWAQEGKGLIQNWDDFEKFPWEKVIELGHLHLKDLEFIAKILPQGMKIAVMGSILEVIMEWVMGYEVVLFNVYDNPELIGSVFNKLGKIMYDFYSEAIELKGVGVLWHGDDIGYKTGTILSPQHLRRWVFPWFKKYSDLAHSHKKPSWLHSCGNKKEVMNDIIYDIKFDAIHAFEDSTYPVVEYKKIYGKDISLLGGVDIDKLARWQEGELRSYMKNVLEVCIKGGKYAFGSGNSIPRYIPIKNYIAMMEIGNDFNNK